MTINSCLRGLLAGLLGGVWLRALLCVFVLGPFIPSLFARELVIQRFDAEIFVQPNGMLDVTETITPRFTGHWNGIYRTIPIEYHTPQGFNYELLLDVQSVTDENGIKLKFERKHERHYLKLKIYVPDAENATRTIVIRYIVYNGLKFFEDHDELYWNITGDEWDVPIQEVNARILLPQGASGMRATSFTGAYGSREQNASVEIVGVAVESRVLRALSFHEGLTIVVGWDKGVVHEPGPVDNLSLFLRSNWPLFLPLVACGAMFWLWYTRGRDPSLRPIAPQYAPPEGLTPAEAGTLVDNSAAMRDITATMVDFAVRGYILIEEQKKDHIMGLWSDKEYVFHLRKKRDEWAGLKAHETVLLDGLFASGLQDTVSLSDLQNKFYKSVPEIRDRIFESLVARNYYLRRPDKVRQTYTVAGIAIGLLSIWGGAALASALGMAPLPFIVAGILTGAVICGFGWFMPARTQTGARALETILGFEDFLGHVEEDRFERTIKTPQMFEKFLPFAMALGVEKKWVTSFQGIYTQPPDWYRGSYGPTFYPIGFVHDLDAMSTRAGTVMSSAPRSSGGSGFSGGSSGGGFGGGGGGGF
ncbi:MAG TPA: DUF2207 domain-containing protein [Candidatus Dormibacteraeota bacterium]|nr:DUF2207 domain-containing protein [Candidatus Dormibacteraeota bacterium]